MRLESRYTPISNPLDVVSKSTNTYPSSDSEEDSEPSRTDEDSPYSMTEQQLAARALKKRRGRFGKQLHVCITVTLGSISAGYVIGSVCPKIRDQYNANEGHYNPDYALFATIVSAGLAVGNFCMSIVSMVRGPRRLMLITAPLNASSWLLIQIMKTVKYQKVGMFFCAFFSISYIRCGSLLLTDGIHEDYYYFFNLIFQTGYGFGMMLGHLFGFHHLLDYYSDALGAIILTALFIALLFCRESPVALYHKSPLKAQEALIALRGRDEIQVLMRQISRDHEARVLTIGTKYIFVYHVVYKSMIIITTLAVLQCFYAYHIFIMFDISMWYTSTRFKMVDIFGEFHDGMVYGVAYYIVPFISGSLNLRMVFGLRKPVMASAITVPFVLVMHSVYYYVLFHTDYLNNVMWLSFAIRILHIICVNFSSSWSLDVMISDYLPEQVQIWAYIGVYTIKYGMFSFLFWLSFMLENLLGASVIIGIFALVSFAGIPFCYFYIVECKGRTLQQLQLAIGGNPIGSRNSFRCRYQNYLTRWRKFKQIERESRLAGSKIEPRFEEIYL